MGFQNCRHVVWPAGLRGSFVLVREAAEHWSAFDPFLGQVGHGAIGPGWLQLQRPMGPEVGAPTSRRRVICTIQSDVADGLARRGRLLPPGRGVSFAACRAG